MLELADTPPARLARRTAADTGLGRLLADGCAATAAVAVAGCGGVILARRLASGIAERPGAAVLLVAVAAGAALVAAADVARRWRLSTSQLPPVVARLGLVLAVAALTVPPRAGGPAGWAAIAAAWLAVAAVVAAFPRATDFTGPLAGPKGLPRGGGRRRTRSVAGAPADVEGRRRTGQLRQRFERREVAAGTDRIRGRIVVVIPAGAKSAAGHLGFCPAFAETPTVRVSTAYDGVEAVVSAAETLPWGVRVECRLAEPAEEPLEIPVDLVAEAAA